MKHAQTSLFGAPTQTAFSVVQGSLSFSVVQVGGFVGAVANGDPVKSQDVHVQFVEQSH